MNVSTRGRYAIRALSHLSYLYKKKSGMYMTIKNIAIREDISERYLENIFVTLRVAGILKSFKGENGGFALTRDPKKISIYDILNVVENEVSPVKCLTNIKECSRTGQCGARKFWAKLDKHISGFLKDSSLYEVALMSKTKKN